MALSRDVSPGIQSQISIDEEQKGEYEGLMNEDGRGSGSSCPDSSSQLQSQLITQISLSQKQSVNLTWTAKRDEEDGQMEYDQVSPANIIDGRSTTTDTSLARRTKSRISSAKYEDFVMATNKSLDGLREDQNESADNKLSNSSDDGVLTQAQIVVPTPASNVQKIAAKVSSEPKPAASEFPTAIANRSSCIAAQYCIEIGLEGRISERMRKIPKDQACILATDDKWYPPLVGSSSMLGTVPMTLLTALTAAADCPDYALTNQDENGSPRHNTDKEKVKDQNELDYSTEDSSKASSEVGSEDWPASNPSPLPPDSSPLGWPKIPPQKSERRTAHANTMPEPPRTDEVFPVVKTGRLRTEAPRERSDQKFSISHQQGRFNSSPKGGLRTTNKIDRVEESGSHAKSSPELQINQTQTSVKVQVHRTPFPSKAGSLQQPPEYPVIPSTFHEGSAHQKHSKALHRSSGQSSYSDRAHLDEFEEDSSEDGLNHRDQDQVDNTVTEPSQMLVDAQVKTHSQSPMTPRDSRTAAVRFPSRKRPLQQQQDALEPQRKRQQGANSKKRNPEPQPSEYYVIDNQRRKNRRQFFKSLASTHNDQSKAIISGKGHLDGTSSTPSIGSDSVPRGSWRSTPDRLHFDAATSDTRPSDHSSYRSGSKDHDFALPPTKQQLVAETLLELFVLFKKAYPNYEGEQKHFDAACRLLEITRNQNSLHPSIWDAFVFHHFHSYRDYLIQVIESSGTALSYPQFFNEIEDVGCAQRIVTLRSLFPSSCCIDTGSDISRKRSVLVDCRAVAARSSISSYLPQKAAASQFAKTKTVLTMDQKSETHLLEPVECAAEASSQSVQAWLNEAFSDRASGAKSAMLGTLDALTHDRTKAISSDVVSTYKNPANVTVADQCLPSVDCDMQLPQQVTEAREGQPPVPGKTQGLQILSNMPQPRFTVEEGADTVFKRFARDYASLASEKNTRVPTKLQSFVNIFGWRR